MIFCARCGEELTAPKFYKGKPYGYTCYSIIAGKKSTDKRQYVETTAIGDDINTSPRFILRVSYNGKVYNLGYAYRDTNGELHNSLAVFGEGNVVYMATHDSKGKALWKSIK